MVVGMFARCLQAAVLVPPGRLDNFSTRSYHPPVLMGEEPMSANGGCLRCTGRTFSETELQVDTEVVANSASLSRAQLMVRVCRPLRGNGSAVR